MKDPSEQPVIITTLSGVEIPILHMDNHLLIVRKPHGLLVQGDHTNDPTLLDAAGDYIKTEFNKPGNVYLGMVHRLDRPAAGIVILTRTSKAAKRLSSQFREKKVKKTYLAWVTGKIPEQGRLLDWISRDGPTSKISNKNNGKPASLSYHRLMFSQKKSLVEVDLETGRHHQIRVQLANQGFPIIGDFRYGSKTRFPNRAIALLCARIEFTHPTLKSTLEIRTSPDDFWPKLPTQG